MKNLVLVPLLIFFAGCAPEHIQVYDGSLSPPDYLNKFRWKYYACDSPTNNFPGDMWVWHQDYVPMGFDGYQDPKSLIMIFYKPVSEKLFKEKGKKEFAKEAQKQPWLLVYFPSQDLENAQLFEFESGKKTGWRYITNFNSEKEQMDYFRTQYQFIF